MIQIRLLLAGFLLCSFAFSQNIPIDRIDPPNWWIGMTHNRLDLLVHGQDLSNVQVSIEHPGITLKGVTRVENPNYLFLDIQIDNNLAKPGLMPIVFQQGGKTLTVQYQLREKGQSTDRIQGVGTEDFIYLIMPDRFANGNPDNDIVEGMNQTSSEREKTYERHGGDLQGIIDHLDYIHELGATALWLNPVEVNDQPEESYHGYAITDHYSIDPRLGTSDDYQSLVDVCHEKDMKVIRDVIYNHVGNQHWFIKDLPSKDWLNTWPEFTKTTYRAPTHLDPYASSYDRKIMVDGWFDKHMPDLNQRNQHVASYLIQNSLWWIEKYGVDGYRIDTYAYPDQKFMADWAEAILAEYPHFTFFGETWVHGVPIQSWFTEKIAKKELDSKLPGVTDFQLYYAINHALTNDFGWTEGVARIYYTLAKDYVYEDPTANVTFLDNHDLGRFASTINEDLDKYKMGIGFLLTTRGIPQIYYGTELLMPNSSKRERDDRYREEFPGGWEDHPKNKFEDQDRTSMEKEAFNFMKTLANYRKSSDALKNGKLMQFVPEEGIYVYFRYFEDETVMVIMNQNNNGVEHPTSRYAERISGYNKAQNVLTGMELDKLETIFLPGSSITILELQN